jgi:hypothetical protein
METPLNDTASTINKEYEMHLLELKSLRHLDVSLAQSSVRSNTNQQTKKLDRRKMPDRRFNNNTTGDMQDQMLMQKDYYQYDGLILFDKVKYTSLDAIELKSPCVSAIMPINDALFDMNNSQQPTKLIERLRRIYECLCKPDEEYKKPFERVRK